MESQSVHLVVRWRITAKFNNKRFALHIYPLYINNTNAIGDCMIFVVAVVLLDWRIMRQEISSVRKFDSGRFIECTLNEMIMLSRATNSRL